MLKPYFALLGSILYIELWKGHCIKGTLFLKLQSKSNEIKISPDINQRIKSSKTTEKVNNKTTEGHYKKAIHTYKESLQFEEACALTYYSIGECYENLDRLDKALSYFHKAVQSDENLADAWYAIALILDFQSRDMEAIHYIKKALELSNS